MRKILIFTESFSIGDIVAAVPCVNKFQEVNPTDDVFISINDWLIPYFSTVYPNLKFLGKKIDCTFDKIIPLVYNYNKPIQQGYAEQLGFINAPYFIKYPLVYPSIILSITSLDSKDLKRFFLFSIGCLKIIILLV